jgi:hypothetical protein
LFAGKIEFAHPTGSQTQSESPNRFVCREDRICEPYGFRAAQRALYLQLDILAGALHASASNTDQGEHREAAATIYTARQAIDAAIDAIELGYKRFRAWPAKGDQHSLVDQVAALASPRLIDHDRAALLSSLDSIYATFLSDYVYDPLRRAATSFYNAVRPSSGWAGSLTRARTSSASRPRRRRVNPKPSPRYQPTISTISSSERSRSRSCGGH